MNSPSLQRVVKGAGIVLIGTVIGMSLGILSRILVIRTITQVEYGIFSLALALFNVFVTISTLGLSEGVTRQIAYYISKSEMKVKEIVGSAVFIASVSSVLTFLILFAASDMVAKLFDTPELAKPLKIISIAIPFSVLLNVLVAVFRGFGKVEIKVYFQNIFQNIFFLLLVTAAFFLGLGFEGVIYAFALSVTATCLTLTFYSLKIKVKLGRKTVSTTKELLTFSIPLLVALILAMAMIWTDTLMLGFFKTPDVVGLYNAAYLLANLIPIFLASTGFMYNPIATQLYSENRMDELKRIYQVITKWIFSATLPMFFVLFLFPEVVLGFLFGTSYVPASSALRILALGFMFHVSMGLNNLSLVAIGGGKLLMYMTLVGAIINVTLNAVLIPPYGITGAALASASSYILANATASTKLYQLSGIHPFTKNYLKLICVSVTLFMSIYVASLLLTVRFWMLPILMVAYFFGYFLFSLLTKSIDKEDLDLLLAIERKIGVNTDLIKNIFKRFV